MFTRSIFDTAYERTRMVSTNVVIVESMARDTLGRCVIERQLSSNTHWTTGQTTTHLSINDTSHENILISGKELMIPTENILEFVIGGIFVLNKDIDLGLVLFGKFQFLFGRRCSFFSPADWHAFP